MTQTLLASVRMALEANIAKDYGITDNKVTQTLGVIDTTDFGVGVTDMLNHKSGTIADAASEDIDLQTVLDPFGVAINLTKIMVLVIRNTTPYLVTAGSIIFSKSAANGWEAPFSADATYTIPPASHLCLVCKNVGWTVDGTHKSIKLLHDGVGTADVTYEIVILGLKT